ncbi:VOC family protein [Puniceibacterium sediminis]|uniref:Glyoxalase-like domain-containing protein n=1 Tax=Puniceibacterium sediminis TaxID=1608407 RepID=A0A238XA59_9RHOB|nr:VOC family protein [Puniceibacterium sediminis]SNR55512.1 Glyoxalase-like domain-containing protein [Puniceibacterium sediminis]
MLVLDHIAVLGETLEEATVHAETALGLPLLPGGKHEHYATHNRLLGLGDGIYLEAIASDPAAPPKPYPRWFGLDRFRGPPRLDKWVCRVDDLEAAVKKFPMAGLPVRLSRGTLDWSMAVPADGQLPFDGMFPALIQWHSPVPPGTSMNTGGPMLESLTVRLPEAAELDDLLGPLLSDDRIRFETGSNPALRAEFMTEAGKKVLQ